jgi:4-diphosphocytidyl-2-C-methyl-D-erythritol kinase
LSALTETAFAKLNLALHVRGRLPDGRHRLETMFAFCEDGDQLEFEPADEIELSVAGVDPVEIGGDNLVLRAAYLLKSASGTSDGVRISLTKHLPIAAGVGGGSADAAATLRALVRLWDIDPDLAGDIAPRLGADVPACLVSVSCRGIGAGDEILFVDGRDLTGLPVLLVNPAIRLGTGEVFARWDGVDHGPLGDWRMGRNDLERPAFSIVPEIEAVLDWLRAQARVNFVRMSGSGATCFALFDDIGARDRAAAAVPPEWWHLATRLR